MYFPGERNREQKLKDIEEYEKQVKEYEAKDKFENTILFVCKECGLQICYHEKQDESNSVYMSFNYENYYVLDGPYNILRFEFKDSFYLSSFSCILE